jgi:putative tRNA adenosine deaminase-associated protein
VVVFRIDGRWEVEMLPARLAEDLPGLLAAVHQQPAENGALGLVNVADEFFVALRIGAGGERLLLSDVTAAVAWDLARQVTTRLGVEVPDDEADIEEVWPAGDLGIFTDLGLDEMELGAILSDLDAYADEQLLLIADRLGFVDPYERAVGA